MTAHLLLRILLLGSRVRHASELPGIIPILLRLIHETLIGRRLGAEERGQGV